MLEYRGYGLSQGSPSEQGFYMDVSAAMDFILTRTDLNIGRIIVFGRSLGNLSICLSMYCQTINTFTIL